LFALGGGLFYALAMISVRWLSATEPAATTVFYFTLFATAAGAPTRRSNGRRRFWRLLPACGIGLIGGVARWR
jgi:hypothetical protein